MKKLTLVQRSIIITIILFVLVVVQASCIYRLELSKRTAAVYEICADANQIRGDLKNYLFENGPPGMIYADLIKLDAEYNAHNSSLRYWSGFGARTYLTQRSNVRYFADRFLMYQLEKTETGEFSPTAIEHMTKAQAAFEDFCDGMISETNGQTVEIERGSAVAKRFNEKWEMLQVQLWRDHKSLN